MRAAQAFLDWRKVPAPRLPGRERHLGALGKASRHLVLAEERYAQLELFAEELRLAQTVSSANHR